MRKTFAALLAGLWLLGAPPASGQPSEGDQLISDIRLFTVLTAINVAGYDAGYLSPSDHPVRRVVREDLKDFQGPTLERLKNFFQQFKQPGAGETLSQYLAFALQCEDPPTFAPRASLPTDLPPDVRRIRALSSILSEFYHEAEIEKLWVRYQPAYEKQIERYQGPLIEALLGAAAYLRFSPTSRQTQSFKVYFSLLGAPNQVYARSYQGAIHVVVQASKKPRIDEVRHAFLMHLLDPLSIRFAEEIGKKDVLARFALFAPALGEVYKSNFQLLVTKSLVKAVETRLDSLPEAESESKIQQALREGYILTPYFYGALAEYEKQPSSFRLYYKDMIRGIQLRREAARLQATKFAPAAARPEPAPARPKLSKTDKLLNEGEGLLQLQELAQARGKFIEALEKSGGRNAQAQYGLGRVAILEGDPDLSREHFRQALESGPDTYIRAMAEVYMGRIEDVVGNREQALVHYRRALASGEPTTRVLELARQGLAEPFGRPDDEEESEEEESEREDEEEDYEDKEEDEEDP